MSERLSDDKLKSWVVYIVKCADGSLYTGITNDLKRRLSEHNNDNKKASRYTRVRRPVTLAYKETCSDRSQASQREHQIKLLERHQKLLLIEASS